MVIPIVLMALSVTASDSPRQHVRAVDSRIVSLIDIGLAKSATFERLVAELDGSDVIVYIEPKQTRQALGGYLSHHIITSGSFRYLRIAIDVQGSQRRLVALLGHELQHAAEVAQMPDVRDSEQLERAFGGRSVAFGCGSSACYETAAAKEVERAIDAELGSRNTR